MTMDAALLITQPFTESGGEAMLVAGFFPFIFLSFLLFQIHRFRGEAIFPVFASFSFLDALAPFGSMLESHSLICVFKI